MAALRLADGGLCVVVDVSGDVPTILHWGVDPGAGGDDPTDVAGALERPLPPASLDVEAPIDLVPSGSAGFPGMPGLVCHRIGGPVAPRFRAADWWSTGPDHLAFAATDADAGVRVDGLLRVGDSLEVSLSVTNLADDDLFLDDLGVTLPVPDGADEVLRFTGEWAREFQPVRLRWSIGTHMVENRRGRTSHDAPPVAFVGPTGFGEHHGDVHGIHLAWSGNHAIRLERLGDGRRYVRAAELLLPGEVVLGPGEHYATPPVHAVAGSGLTACSQRFHRMIRTHLPDTPRPVLLNTWEAVYFDHDLDRLRSLAERAAAVGIERFVLDDGWFGGRRNDRAGLGDWWVSPEVYPDGLAPLIAHVTGLGMEFGIWVEPEMVNPDSDLFRAHPDWVLGNPDVLGRNQLVLDVANPDCFAHLFDELDRLLAEHDISFVKWDMNRDLAGAGAHRQTLALYALIDELRSAHPSVEFESCASGGGRADAAILERTVRIWTSDCNDPLERQTIQRGFSHLFPPEVMGAHIGPPRAHTTGRSARLSFRAATALFGHLGVEWNLLECSDRELEKLSAWIAQHKRLRPLLHTGDVVRLDHPDPAALAHGVVSTDRREAVFSLAQLRRGDAAVPPRLVLVGLDAEVRYRVERISMPGDVLGLTLRQPAWVDEGLEATGATLMSSGLQPPALLAESTLLLHVVEA